MSIDSSVPFFSMLDHVLAVFVHDEIELEFLLFAFLYI